MPKEPARVLNLSDIETKRRLMTEISTLSGLYEVKLKPRKKTRTLDQNAYYWSAVVTPFTEWLRAEWGDRSITTEQAHNELKRAILGVKTKLNERTGEEMELMPSSKTLDTMEFSDYLEGCVELLARMCGIVVLSPEMFYEKQN